MVSGLKRCPYHTVLSLGKPCNTISWGFSILRISVVCGLAEGLLKGPWKSCSLSVEEGMQLNDQEPPLNIDAFGVSAAAWKKKKLIYSEDLHR